MKEVNSRVYKQLSETKMQTASYYVILILLHYLVLYTPNTFFIFVLNSSVSPV